MTLVTLILCGCSSITAQPETTGAAEIPQATFDPNTPLCDGNTLRMLVVTSSFGLNTTQFLYDIAKAEGAENVVIGRLYYSGCTLKMHAEYAKTNAAVYDYTKNTTGEWVKQQNTTLEYGLKDEDWDIIYLQQGAASSPIANTYEGYLDEVLEYLQTNKTNPNARFVWNMTWAYQGDSDQNVFINTFNCDQMAMYNSILNAVKTHIVSRPVFEAIIPSGTAIQNARTSYFGDHLTKDTYHLNNLGRAIAGYTVWSTITGEPLTEINLGPVSSYDLPDVLELTAEDRQVIIECVNNALTSPWEVTSSSYPQQ